MSETVGQKNPNALLIAFRKYHSWLGLLMTVFILTVALTGIYLNHKDLFQGEKDSVKQVAESEVDPDGLSTTTDLERLPVTFAQALAVCRDRLGEQSVEKIELKYEKGRLAYRIKAASGELVVDASSGQDSLKPRSESKSESAKDKSRPTTERAAIEAEKVTKPNAAWGKWIKDLHTGKIGGLTGKLLMDFTALVLVVLSMTGIYLWLVPLLRKRRSAKQRAAATRNNATKDRESAVLC